MYASPQLKPALPSLPATGNILWKRMMRGGCNRRLNVCLVVRIYCVYKVKRSRALIQLESIVNACSLEADIITNNCTYILAEIALLYRHECSTGKYTTRKIHKNYIRDPSGLFFIISHVSLSIM